MHDQPIPAASDAALLDLLLEEYAGLWAIDELARSLGSSSRTADPTDAIERLHAHGLIHRFGDFVFATRAAHAAQQLGG